MNIWAQRYETKQDDGKTAQWTAWFRTKGAADDVRRGIRVSPGNTRRVGPIVKHSIAVTTTGVKEALNRFARDYVPTEEKGQP